MIIEYDGLKFYGYDGEYFRNPEVGYLHVYKYQLETGIKLIDSMVVHHIDGNKHNNNIDNLVHMFNWCHLRMHSRGKILSDETKHKISKVHKGKILSDETKHKISEARKGKILSDETKHKMSKARKGKILSDETKHKMSEAHRDKTCKPARCVEIGIIYPSLKASAEAVGLKSISNISDCLAGINKTAGGYHWEYVEK